MMTPALTFDIKRDSKLVAAGTHFWCWGCLVARPLNDQSSDPRYCRGCHDFLQQEVAVGGRRPGWAPKVKRLPPVSTRTPTIKHQPLVSSGTQLSPTQLPPRTNYVPEEGPKHRDLPVGLIKGMVGSSRAIAARLKADGAADISYKTIQRIRAGERQLPLGMGEG